MKPTPQDDIIRRQFSPQAQAYLTSEVHAAGADLALMSTLVGHRPQACALDLGCGGGHVSFTLSPQVAQVEAVDLSSAMLRVVADEAQRRGLTNIQTRQAAAEALPYPDAHFDLVVTRYSCHHWQALPAGLAQMRRVIKPGGLALFMDVITPGEPLLDTWLQSLELLRDPSHVRNGSEAQWQAQLVAAGFRLTHCQCFRLRLSFASWVARMNTPAVQIAAIRALQQQAGPAVVDYFNLEEDGSFTVDTLLLAAEPATGAHPAETVI
ncbi:class I SAM-dependent methyltransferase [Pseudaeromonas sp. ZJS20]|uniref:class I SAM-dependent methyltransferase n=1 Tax=Pseudaeromonas aegiceratis TaxID=3153928 RepID=UPI00390CB82D